MDVFEHHLYEYKKGLRRLILYTAPAQCEEEIVQKLDREQVAWLVQPVSAKKINVFFGHPDCVDVIRSFAKVSLSDFTAEEDFMLGTLLGYDQLQQCLRYLRRKTGLGAFALAG